MRLPISDNTNLHPISHRFQTIVDYWSNLHFQHDGRLPLFNMHSCTLVRDESLNSRPRN